MRCDWTVLRYHSFCGYSPLALLSARCFDLFHHSVCTISLCTPVRSANQLTTDTQLLSHVWARFRAYPNERLPADQREFWISRGGYLQKEGVKKIFVFDWVFRGQLPKRVDVIKASHQAFSIIVDAVLKDDLDLLRRRGLCTVPSCLQYHRDELSKLSSKQKKVFEVTKDDLLGRHGILRAFHDHPFHNMRIISALKDDSTRTNYLLYGVMLVALYKKKLLFNAVCNHPLPSSYEWGTNERMILRMPPGYGFLQRKHLVVYLEFAQPLNLESRTITDDVTLFDFHIACF
ncbi:hypothetical protein Tcan_02672 [Toxocara canis]|uniref:Uncharacterized protein n=1 Tax=Toxocara canis TaxID=6265 RepID=A0A0B2VYY9_TOXCA|nr:hypothetical protein Tcan_02672 [Toxocara canis]